MNENKASLRRIAYDRRDAEVAKEAKSVVICRDVIDLPEYESAETVLWYLHCRSEVRTIDAVNQQLMLGKVVVIPFCTRDGFGNNALGLWRLKHIDELVKGTWNILEPPAARWYEPERIVEPAEIDVAIIPGVAFTMKGVRLGNGAGYYDHLLKQMRPDALFCGIGFQAQLLPEIPIEEHDVLMDKIITEVGIYKVTK